MATYSERLETAVTSAETEATKLVAIVEGPSTGGTSTVSTANGSVKTIARVIAEAETALADAVTSLETSATASAAAAATSATNSANSATASATSATNSATSATASANSATASATSATNSANSATASATSATESATSATASATSATASATSATLSSDWASKTDGIVAATDYSAKEFASGSQAATGGSAKNWAQQTDGDVTGAAANSRSAKAWAQDDLTGATLGGSAKDWAQHTGSTVNGTEYSAKKYAQDSATSATASAASAASASTQATSAGTSAGQAATSAAQAAAIAAGLNYKGQLAGASVPATSTAAGDCYVIYPTAGTSQSKTWAVGDLAIYRGSSGMWDLIPASVVMGIVAALRNGFSPRGGIHFDGTSGARVTSTLTNQPSIGTDAFSITVAIKVPTSNPTSDSGFVGIGLGSTSLNVANSCFLFINASGTMGVQLNGAGSADHNIATVAGIVAAYGGKIIIVTFVRNASGNPTLYINGVAQTLGFTTGGTPPTWQGSVTSTYFAVGYFSTTTAYRDAVYSASFYNLALTASDALEIYELNGGVPFRFQFGTQTPIYSSDFTSGVDTWGSSTGVVDGNIDAINGVDDTLRFYANASAANHAATRTGYNMAPNKVYRVAGSLYIPTGQTNLRGAALYFNGESDGNTSFTVLSGARVYTENAAWQTINMLIRINKTSAYTSIGVYGTTLGGTLNFTGANVSTDDRYYLKGMTLHQLGAVCHLGCEDGVGRMVRDSSTNKLHATRTASGTAPLIPKDDGAYTQLTLTANGELLDTSGLLETDGLLVDVVVKNTTANQVYGFGIGMASGVRDLTYETDIPANSVVVLPIQRADLAGLTVGTSPFGRVYYSAASWNSGSINISIRYRRERDL